MALRQMGFDLKIFHSCLRFSACVKEAKGETSLILSSVSFLGGYFTVKLKFTEIALATKGS